MKLLTDVWRGLRSILTMAAFVLYTIICSVLGILSSTLPRRTWAKRAQDKTQLLWSKGIFFLFRVRILIEGLENLPTGPAVYVFNHTSFFDIFALVIMDERVRFGAKIELFRIPIFGYTLKLYGMLPISRNDRGKTLEIYEQAKKNFLNGQRYALAPEGTRNLKEELLPFKSGPFFFAKSAEVPIVPIIIQGACFVWPKSHLFPEIPFFRRMPIRVRLLPATSIDTLKTMDRRELQNQIRNQMNQALVAMRQVSTEGPA